MPKDIFLNNFEMQRYIQATAKRGNLSVEWRKDAVPHTDGNKIVLPLLDARATELDYRKQLHLATHETDHVLYTDTKLVSKSLPGKDAMNTKLGSLWNALEDHRIEWLNNREYEGDRQNSNTVVGEFTGPLAKKIKQALATPMKDKIQSDVLPLLTFRSVLDSEMYSSSTLAASDFASMLDEQGKKVMAKFQKGDYAEEMRRIRDIADPKQGTQATLDLADRIYREVFEEDPEEARKQMAKGQPKAGEGEPCDDGEGKGEGGKDEGEGEGKEKGKGKGKGEGESESEADNDKRGTKARTKEVSVPYKEFTGASDMPARSELPDPSSAGTKVSYSRYERGPYVPATRDHVAVCDFSKPDPQHTRNLHTRNAHRSYFEDAHSDNADGFAARVRTILQIRSKDRFQYGTKRGKLMGSALWKVPMNQKGLSDRVFKQRIVSDTLDTAVCVVVDSSGSMSGPKYGHAMSSAVLLNESIGNVLQIPLMIVGFTDCHDVDPPFVHGDPYMVVHRGFNTRRLDQDTLVERMGRVSLMDNPDGDAVAWAYDQIRQVKAKRKLLIVLSDGSPACARPGDIMGYTQDVVAKIHQQRLVEIVGIGIMDRNVTLIYPEHYVINKSDELEGALLSLIQKKLS